MKTKILFITVTTLLFVGCNELKRFRSAKIDEATSSEKYVSVTLFSSKTESPNSPSTAKTVWELQSDGQAAFIQKFSDPNTDKDKLAESLNQKFLSEDNNAPLDFTKKNVRIVLSVTKNRDYSNRFVNYTPADRIDYFNMKLNIAQRPDGYPKFIQWNKFETKFDTIKIADVTFERTIDAKVSAKAGNDNSKNSAGVDFDATNKRTVAQSLKYRYVSLNGALNPKFLQLEEEGNREIDLNDNIIIDAVIEFDSSPDNFIVFKNLFENKSGKANSADKASINILYFNMPDYPDDTPLKAIVDFNYLFRHVTNSKLKTYPEFDDRVRLINGHNQTDSLEIIKADEIKPKRWKIVFINGGSIEVLHTFSQSQNAIDVQFSDFYEASTFARWLSSYPTNANTDLLKIGDLNFSIGNAKSTALNKQYFIDHKMEVKIVPF